MNKNINIIIIIIFSINISLINNIYTKFIVNNIIQSEEIFYIHTEKLIKDIEDEDILKIFEDYDNYYTYNEINDICRGIFSILSDKGYSPYIDSINDMYDSIILIGHGIKVEKTLSDIIHEIKITPVHSLNISMIWNDELFSGFTTNVLNYYISTPPEENGLYINNTIVTILVDDNEYAVLDRWGGHYTQNGGESITFCMNKDMDILIILEPIPIELNINDLDDITIDQETNVEKDGVLGYRYGTELTITSEKNDFKYWEIISIETGETTIIEDNPLIWDVIGPVDINAIYDY